MLKVEEMFKKYHERLSNINTTNLTGTVSKATSMLIESLGPEVHVGELCRLTTHSGDKPVLAEVVGFKDKKTLLMPIADMHGISPKSEVIATGQPLKIKLGMSLRGRLLDGLGNPMDNKGPVNYDDFLSI